jgi:hypothetical protein
MSDIEGKTARVAAMECGQRQSFNSRDRLCRLDCARTQANKDNSANLKRVTARATDATAIRMEPELLPTRGRAASQARQGFSQTDCA